MASSTIGKIRTRNLMENCRLHVEQHVVGCINILIHMSDKLLYINPCVTPPPRPHSQTQRSIGRNSGHKHFTDGEKVTALPIRQFPLFIGNDQSLFLSGRRSGQRDKEISYRFLPSLSYDFPPIEVSLILNKLRHDVRRRPTKTRTISFLLKNLQLLVKANR